ncbi:MAG: DUF928 domain-containing protein [Cyanobacteriota bacterium]|nr:DUF928 domain-containing protein [Cyanobacteriota bacterium]
MNKWILSTSAIAALFAPVLVGFAPNPSQTTVSPTVPTLLSLTFPRSPGGRRGPARTASGGARSTTCFVKGVADRVTPMTVLMPTNNIGTTADADPALLVFIPESRIDGGEVRIFEQVEEQEVYVGKFDLSNKPGDTPGIVKLNLEEANLEADKTYEWSFTPFCLDDRGEPDLLPSPFLEGTFQRTPLTPVQDAQLERAESPLEQAEIYARSGIWSETLNLAEQLRPSEPQEWMNLLESVELGELAEAPYFGEAQLMGVEEDDGKGSAEAPLENPGREPTTSPSTPIEGLW